MCAECDHPLFSSVAKYQHQTPWPAFTVPLRKDSLSKRPETEQQDSSDCYALKVCFHCFHLFSKIIEFKQNFRLVAGNAAMV